MQKIHIEKNKISKLHSRIHNLLVATSYHPSLQFEEWHGQHVLQLHHSLFIFCHIYNGFFGVKTPKFPPLIKCIYGPQFNMFACSLIAFIDIIQLLSKNQCFGHASWTLEQNNIMKTKCIIANTNNFTICSIYKVWATKKITWNFKIFNKQRNIKVVKTCKKTKINFNNTWIKRYV